MKVVSRTVRVLVGCRRCVRGSPDPEEPHGYCPGCGRSWAEWTLQPVFGNGQRTGCCGEGVLVVR